MGLFVGVNDEEGTYRIYDTEKRVIVKSRDVMFFESTKIPESIFEGAEKEILYLKEDVEEVRNTEKERRYREEESEESEEENEVPQVAQPLPPVQEFVQQPRAQRRERRVQERSKKCPYPWRLPLSKSTNT